LSFSPVNKEPDKPTKLSLYPNRGRAHLRSVPRRYMIDDQRHKGSLSLTSQGQTDLLEPAKATNGTLTETA
jgi:hypothetical protein